MRQKLLIITGVVIVVGAVGYYLSTKLFSTDSSTGAIELVNLPDQYCPTIAQVVVATITAADPKVLLDSKAAVVNCRTIDLGSIVGSSKKAVNVWIKLPLALASKVSIDSPSASYQVSPTLGDVNGDNVINESDQSLVEGSILAPTTTENLDIDGDRRVTVIDLGIVRINFGAGIARPDGKSWSKDG